MNSYKLLTPGPLTTTDTVEQSKKIQITAQIADYSCNCGTKGTHMENGNQNRV